MQSSKIWKLQLYGLVYEFHNKPFLPPPFLIFNYFFSFVKFVVGVCNKILKIKVLKNFTAKKPSGFGMFQLVDFKSLFIKIKGPTKF